jgi:hypothetical protein
MDNRRINRSKIHTQILGLQRTMADSRALRLCSHSHSAAPSRRRWSRWLGCWAPVLHCRWTGIRRSGAPERIEIRCLPIVGGGIPQNFLNPSYIGGTQEGASSMVVQVHYALSPGSWHPYCAQLWLTRIGPALPRCIRPVWLGWSGSVLAITFYRILYGPPFDVS